MTMEVTEVVNKIKQIPLFSGFKWFKASSNESQFSTLTVPNRNFKDAEKNEFNLGSFYSLFIAHMYKGQKDKEFFYLILSRKGEKRIFRQHRFFEIEFNKLFASGKTVDEIIDNLNKKIEQSEYTLK